MNIIDVIRKRRSCRTFHQEPFRPADREILEGFIRDNRTSWDDEKIDLAVVEKGMDRARMKLDYGLIRGHSTFILGASKSAPDSREHYGYLMEKVVLKATEMGLSTCWIGYFDDGYFPEITIEKGFEIPSIVAVGYPAGKETFSDKFVRFAVKASKRLPWDELFFHYRSGIPLSPETADNYSDSLEMVRLAPSSGNTQPWRVYYDGATHEFHFFKKPVSQKYEAKGLHDVDMGIALAHFELTALSQGLPGRWIGLSKQDRETIDDLQYVLTWKGESSTSLPA